MRIMMKTVLAGPEGTAQPGQTIDRPEPLARALVAGGFAVAVQEEQAGPAIEEARVSPPETATPRRGRRKVT